MGLLPLRPSAGAVIHALDAKSLTLFHPGQATDGSATWVMRQSIR